MTSTPTSAHHLVCFSHLRWNFVFQRPQHLLTRFARNFKVYYVEEPIFDATEDTLDVTKPGENLWVVVPHLREGLKEEDAIAKQKELLANFFIQNDITHYFFWY